MKGPRLGLFALVGVVSILSGGWLLQRGSLVPVKDPRLPESLAFEQG